MILEFTFILAALATAGLLARFFPELTARWFKRIQQFKTVIYGVFVILVASVLVGSGSPWLVLWGFAMLVLLALALIVDGPLEDRVMP